MTQYCIGLGHRRLAYVTLCEPINTVQDRMQGYLNAIRDSFGDDRFEMVIMVPWYGVSNWPLFDAVFALPADERPTAVVCLNDYAAVRVAERLEFHNLKVPADVAIIGFDNIVQFLPGGMGLSTVAQPFEEIGKTAANILLKRLDFPTMPPVHMELPCRLIVRDSSGGDVGVPQSKHALEPALQV